MAKQLDYQLLTKVTQQDLNEGVWDAEHKGLYSKDGKKFLHYFRPKSIERGVPDTFQLKTGVEVICEKAFAKGFFPLTSFIIPKSVVAIGDEAFQQIQLPRHANFTITKGLKFIGYKILGNYEGILNLIIEEGVKEIDLSYILDCAPAVTLYLPSTLESIGDKGFGEVDNTEHIHLAEGNKHFRLDNGVLYNYDKTELLRCPVTKRGDFIIPEGVTTIGAYAFRLSGYKDAIDAEPESKLSVVLPQSLTTIKKGAFRHTWIDSIFIPANVSEIEEGAFEDAIHLTIEVSPENNYYEVRDNHLIDKFDECINQMTEDIYKFMEEEERRMRENGLLYGIIFDNEEYDLILNYSKADFELKKEDLKDYVFVDKLTNCKDNCEAEYINRTYKFIRMEDERCAIFYRDY